MRILVFSDSHGVIGNCLSQIARIGAVDMILHAGDVSADAEDIASVYPDIPVRYVSGNCEMSRADTESIVEADGVRIFLTHGHGYRVKYEPDYATLLRRGRQVGARVCVFGHTHKPLCHNLGDITLLNPGSSRYGGTYAVIEIEDGKVGCAVLDM